MKTAGDDIGRSIRPRVKIRTWAALALAAMSVSLPGWAHEFWLWSEPFSPAVGASARLTLNVGEYFVGDLVGFGAQNAASMRRYAAGVNQDLSTRARSAVVRPDFRLDLPAAGTHLVAFDSNPTLITLAADKFHAYLHEEGLDAIVQQREDAKTAAMPGRERYRRCAKALLKVGGRSDATYAVRTGQRLEILPLADPLAKAAGEALEFALLFDGRPIVKRLVKAWHKRDGQTIVIRAHSDAAGKVVFNLPYAGPWMISVVHMIPAADTADADWDSFWGNLTFEVPR